MVFYEYRNKGVYYFNKADILVINNGADFAKCLCTLHQISFWNSVLNKNMRVSAGLILGTTTHL